MTRIQSRARLLTAMPKTPRKRVRIGRGGGIAPSTPEIHVTVHGEPSMSDRDKLLWIMNNRPPPPGASEDAWRHRI